MICLRRPRLISRRHLSVKSILKLQLNPRRMQISRCRDMELIFLYRSWACKAGICDAPDQSADGTHPQKALSAKSYTRFRDFVAFCDSIVVVSTNSMELIGPGRSFTVYFGRRIAHACPIDNMWISMAPPTQCTWQQYVTGSSVWEEVVSRRMSHMEPSPRLEALQR